MYSKTQPIDTSFALMCRDDCLEKKRKRFHLAKSEELPIGEDIKSKSKLKAELKGQKIVL